VKRVFFFYFGRRVSVSFHAIHRIAVALPLFRRFDRRKGGGWFYYTRLKFNERLAGRHPLLRDRNVVSFVRFVTRGRDNPGGLACRGPKNARRVRLSILN